MTDRCIRECGGEVNHSSSMSNPDPSRAALADELLPCPFCGGTGAMCVLEDEPGEIISAWVNCSCGVEFHERRTEAEAAAKWNARALPERLDCGALARRIELARKFIAREYNDPAQELRGDWIDPRAKPAHDALCLCLQDLSALPPTLNSGADRPSLDDPAPEPCADLSIIELIEWLDAPQYTNGFLDFEAANHMSAAAELLEKLLALPRVVEGGADREKVCAHESCLNCVCPERNFCTGTYYRVLALPRTVEGGAVILAEAELKSVRQQIIDLVDSGARDCEPIQITNGHLCRWFDRLEIVSAHLFRASHPNTGDGK